MIELKDWINTVKLPNKPWLVLGKGPSFSARDKIDLEQFNTLGLNHVIREQKVTCAHIIDIDVVEHCQETLLANCEWLIMPRVPHVKCFASEYMNLKDWLHCLPVLAEAEKRCKLVTYSLAHIADENDPWTIEAKYFSSEVAFGILGRMKVKQVSLLGLDGGVAYSQAFDDLSQNTLLVNKQPNFDLQFQQLERIARQFDFQYAHLMPPAAENIKPKTEKMPTDAVEDKTAREADPEIILPDVHHLKIGATHNQKEKDAEFISLPAAMEYAAAYIYRRKVFPKAQIAIDEKQTAAEKIQTLENDLRLYRARLEECLEELGKVSKDFTVCHQRLTWARTEAKEYCVRATDLEKSLHRLVQSAGWKVGRLLTKPAQIIGKALAKPGTEDKT